MKALDIAAIPKCFPQQASNDILDSNSAFDALEVLKGNYDKISDLRKCCEKEGVVVNVTARCEVLVIMGTVFIYYL